MLEAGRAAASVLSMIAPHVKPGVTTEALNRLCHDFIVDELHCIPAPLNYGGGGGRPPFPKSVCTSVNHVVCHGIPGEKQLKRGDTINIDVTVIKDGFHGDTSQMFSAGEPSVLARRLSEVTREAMFAGIRKVRPGARLGDIGYAVQQVAVRGVASQIHAR
ncbi:MAG: M24 family metallopeptidase, partial [Nevskia sp.]|nr:M24 family metallopeptidase [Nevskia sp.]